MSPATLLLTLSGNLLSLELTCSIGNKQDYSCGVYVGFYMTAQDDAFLKALEMQFQRGKWESVNGSEQHSSKALSS